MLACERIADGPQEYHEANTPDGWADVFIDAAREGKTPEQIISDRPRPVRMSDAERTST